MSTPTNEDQTNLPAPLDERSLRQPRFSGMEGALLIVGFVLLAYLPSLSGGFQWDDNANITPPEQRSLAGLGRIWFQLGATQTYYPVLHTVFWVENRLWGLHTLGYHLASILFHSVSVGLLYLIMRRLRIPGAYLAAAIFAVHPVYVESIAWITEQKNTLSVMLYLGSILAYLYFDDSRQRSTYALSLALFVLSLASKTNAVTLPPALLVILWWKRGKLSWRRDVVPLIPWFVLSLLLGMFTVWYERVYVGVEGTRFILTPLQKCLLASRAFWFYLSKLFWPTNLTFIYLRWEVNTSEAWQYLFPVGFLALFASAWLAHWRWRGPWTALLLYFGTLFPMLGFFATYIFSFTYVCDHFQYLPSVAIVVLVSAGIASYLDRLTPTPQRIGHALCVLLVATLGVLTWRQCHLYRDAITLYQATIDRNPDCWMAHNNLGLTLSNLGQSEEAMAHYRQALRIKPDFAEGHYNLGLELYEVGRPHEAIDQYREALQYETDVPADYDNLGNALLKTGQTDEAIACYRQAIRINPGNADAHNNLGYALFKANRPQEAIEQYKLAMRFNPNYVKAHVNLAVALADQDQLEEAIQQYQEALRIKPESYDATINLAYAYAKMQRSREAIATAEIALSLARAEGKSAIAGQVEGWLSAYQASLSNPADKSAPTKSLAP